MILVYIVPIYTLYLLYKQGKTASLYIFIVYSMHIQYLYTLNISYFIAYRPQIPVSIPHSHIAFQSNIIGFSIQNTLYYTLVQYLYTPQNLVYIPTARSVGLARNLSFLWSLYGLFHKPQTPYFHQKSIGKPIYLGFYYTYSAYKHSLISFIVIEYPNTLQIQWYDRSYRAISLCNRLIRQIHRALQYIYTIRLHYMQYIYTVCIP